MNESRVPDLARGGALPAAVGAWLVALSGCATPGPNRADLAAAIARTGQASIESSTSDGNHFRVFYIDGAFVAAGKVYGIYPMSPGTHTVGIEAEFPQRRLTGETIDAGDATLTVDVRAGVRYKITGKLRGPGVAEVKVVEVPSGSPAGPSQTILMSTTAQNQFEDEPPAIAVPIPRDLQNSRQLAVSAGVVLAELLLRKYYDGEPPSDAWTEAPGPAVVMPVHDEMRIKEALVMRLHEEGYSLCADLQHRIEFSHHTGEFVAALSPIHHGETRVVFDDFLFQETPAGIRVCASRTVPGEASGGNDGATVQMNRRNFAELKALLESVRTDLGGLPAGRAL